MKSDSCLVLRHQFVPHLSDQQGHQGRSRTIGRGASTRSLPEQPPRMTPQHRQQRHQHPGSDSAASTSSASTSSLPDSGRMDGASNDANREHDDHDAEPSPSSSSSDDDGDSEGSESITTSSCSSSSSLDDVPSSMTTSSVSPPLISYAQQDQPRQPTWASRPPSHPHQEPSSQVAAATITTPPSTSPAVSHYQQRHSSLVRKRSCSTISAAATSTDINSPHQGPPNHHSAVAHLTASSASASPASSPSHSPGSARVLVKVPASQQQKQPHQTEVDRALKALHEANADAELAQFRNRQVLFARLEASAPLGKLSLINLSRQGIGPAEAHLLKQAILINPHLSVLKLAYNHLGNDGAEAIAASLGTYEHGGICHHENLSVLDLEFNDIGDAGCEALAVRVVAGNYRIRTLCLTANSIRVRGALAIAGAIVHGTGLARLLLAANPIRSKGLEAIATAIAKHDAKQIVSISASMAGASYGTAGEPPVTISGMEELDVGSSCIDSAGFISVPAMLLTNATIQTLCLENNNLNDTDMALLSQSLAQNKNVPLRVLKLSFNQISCTGVECLMNAVWGSPTLRDLALDNNKIQDRGAQLCAVVLTSIALERLDLSFNRVTTNGLKALMKNISENNSMQCLHLSGIPIDLNGSKAVSFALAYNNSLRAMYLDNCSTGYSSQRHIVAGIVSNRRSSLRVLTGFSIGPVARTLGMPNLPESWSNDQVLGFFRLMWQQWLLKSGRGVAPRQDDDAVRGPAPPAAVAAAAKITLSALAVGTGTGMDGLFHTEAHEKTVAEGPPVEPTASALLERTDSGTMRVPSFPSALVVSVDEAPADCVGFGRRSDRNVASPRHGMSTVRGPLENPERRNRNLQWLRQHFRSLGEVGRLPFCNADLWQLHQYYFSPPFSARAEADDGHSSSRSPFSSASPTSCDDSAGGGVVSDRPAPLQVVAPPPTPAFGMSSTQQQQHHRPEPRMGMGRAVSFQALGDAFAASGLLGASHSNSAPARRSTRRSNRHKGGRRSHDEFEEDDDDHHCGGGDHHEEEGAPAFKRVKGVGKPRIAYYPRVMAKIQGLGTKPMEQSLSLLRQLKYAENVIFAGRDPYAKATVGSATGSPASGAGAAASAAAGSPWSMASASSTASSVRGRRGSEDDMDDENGDDANLSHSDVEMILLDLL